MTKKLHFVALDMGAESGRVMLGKFSGVIMSLEEVYRFDSVPVRVPGGLYTDVLHIWTELRRGLAQAVRSGEGELNTIGVDTWGVDFALLDKDGALLANPYQYRDSLTEGILPKAFLRVPKEEIYEHTGVQCMPINTLYQLYALKLRKWPCLDAAERLLMMPDLFNYWLTGIQSNEFCIATTSQCYDPRAKSWATAMLKKFKLPEKIFGNIIKPGTVIGELQPKIAAEIGLAKNVRVIAPGCHDTALAVAAVPAVKKDFAYISCGTWSLVGAELSEPCITDKSLSEDFTNEGGVCGTFRFLKNLTGLWIVQECRRAWERQGRAYTYAQLTQMASEAKPLFAFINPSYHGFAKPGDMPDKIRYYCRHSEQPTPTSDGAIIRCALESLALSYRQTLEQLESILNRKLNPLHIVGGGTQNKLLCQLAADATGRQVKAGPVEATAIGSASMQAMSLGFITSLDEVREIVRRSFEIATYEPSTKEDWNDAYLRFLNLRNPIHMDLD